MKQGWKPKYCGVAPKKLEFHTISHQSFACLLPLNKEGEIPWCHPTCLNAATTSDKNQRVRVPLPLLFPAADTLERQY